MSISAVVRHNAVRDFAETCARAKVHRQSRRRHSPELGNLNVKSGRRDSELLNTREPKGTRAETRIRGRLRSRDAAPHAKNGAPLGTIAATLAYPRHWPRARPRAGVPVRRAAGQRPPILAEMERKLRDKGPGRRGPGRDRSGRAAALRRAFFHTAGPRTGPLGPAGSSATGWRGNCATQTGLTGGPTGCHASQ
jgi:hypothetical protein